MAEEDWEDTGGGGLIAFDTNSLKQGLKIYFIALVALMACAALLGIAAAIDSWYFTDRLFDSGSAFIVYFLYTVALGFVPLTFVGIPTYLSLRAYGRATWPLVLLVGIFPGFVILFLNLTLGVIAIFCGITVAAITHALTIKQA